MATPGITYALASGSVSDTADGDGSDASFSADGLLGRFGLGFDFRVNPGFAIHPDVVVLKGLSESNSGLLYMVGLGFNFGALPDFSDVK